MSNGVARGLAFAMGVVMVIGAAASIIRGHTQPTAWIIDVRWAGRYLAAGLPLAIGVAFLWFGTKSSPPARGSRVGFAASCVVGGFAMVDCVRFWLLLSTGEITTAMPVPASLLVVIGALWIARSASKRAETSQSACTSRDRLATLACCLTALAAFPIASMICFGLTDYRRKVDAVLVFGARAYADGSPSDALEDRMLAACDLIHAGYADVLIVSGGPGDGPFHETDVMRRIASERGIEERQIIVDRQGVNTRSSIVNAARIAQERGLTAVIAVSHFYHLPRIKLEAASTGLRAFTVPASQRGRTLRALPYFMAREAVAWWRSFGRAIGA